jgi:hypothetical protein
MPFAIALPRPSRISKTTRWSGAPRLRAIAAGVGRWAPLLALAMFLAHGEVRATTLDEGVIGDLSSDINAPTPFELTAGSNRVIANSGGSATGGATNGTDAEFLTVIVPDGLILDQIVVVDRVGASERSFIGYNAGVSLPGQTEFDILDSAIFFSTSGNLLTKVLFPDPLDESLAFWIQETSGSVDYELNFIAVVPEPGTALLLGLGLSMIAALQRRMG